MNDAQAKNLKNKYKRGMLASKGEVGAAINDMLISGISDDGIQNAEDVAAMAATISVSKKVVIKAPKAMYKVSKGVLKGSYKTGYAIGKTGVFLSQKVKNSKIKKIDTTTKKIAYNYISAKKDIETKSVNKKKTNNSSFNRNKNRNEKLIAEAEKFGIEVADKDTINSYKGADESKVWGADKKVCSKESLMISTSGEMSDDIISDQPNAKAKKKKDKKDKDKKKKDKKKKSRKNKIKSMIKGVIIAEAVKSDSREAGVVKRMSIKYVSLISKVVKTLALTTIKTLIAIIALIAPYLAIPALVVVIIVLLFSIPPLSWLTYNTESPAIIITYQDKMREFGIKIDAYEADDNSIINYNLDVSQLKKDALMVLIAKKGVNYRFDNVTEEDAKIYADALNGLMSCTMDIDGYVEINDKSLITKKYIDLAVKAGTGLGDKDNGMYVMDSCNVHGVTAERVSGKIVHTTSTQYFIPCEVSQYSVLPVGLCIQITEPNSKESYILQIVDKYEDTADDNEYLYFCGDMRAADDFGNPKDIHIYTNAYGPVRYFSNTNLISKDSNVLYTGILDKAVANKSPSYNILYRTASSLAKEFNMTSEEQEAVFGKLNDVTEEELINAKIRVPKKEINIWNEDVNFYADHNFNEEEKENFEQIKKLVNENSEHFDKLIKTLLGNLSMENVINTAVDNAGSSAASMSKYLFDICIKNGMFIPSNASQLAKFVVDNGMEVNEKDLKNGDLIFISRDVGTYKDVTDVAVKVEGGYLNYWNGQIRYETFLRINTNTTYGSVVMYGRLKN